MTQVVVVAPPAGHDLATALAEQLAARKLEATAPDFSGVWDETRYRAVIAAMPDHAFVVVCLAKGADKDTVLSRILWHAAPMKEDPTGRFLFAVFDRKAADGESIAAFPRRHARFDGSAVQDMADHIAAHADALTKHVTAVAEARRLIEEERARNPPPPRTEGVGSAYDGPMGVGAGRRPEGIGAADIGASERPRRVGAAWSDDDVMYSRAPMPRPLSAPVFVPGPDVKLDKADAAAFTPKKLRRGTAELLRVAVFRPQDRGRAAREAKQADAQTSAAGSVQQLGKLPRGAIISVVVDARGATCEPSRIDAEWRGSLVDFSFAVEADLDSSVAQAMFTVRLLVDGAQLGAITFVRPLTAPKKKSAASKLETAEKLRRVERAFLSYSDKDRESVALIANAYKRAGIPCFFDRVSLKSGEEWSPRLLKEIDRADLFHLCWSQSASTAKGVEKEVSHALTKRRKSWSKRPDITIQMLDGPPWAPHPQSLDALHFDDFERAAIAGYRGGVQAGPATPS